MSGTTDPYLSEWDPRAYLRQYYSTPHLPDESEALLRFLNEQLSRRPAGYRRAIDFGCGPALYTAIAIAPHVRELHLADYLPANLAEIRRWLDGDPAAHDWDVYFRAVLEIEVGRPPTAECLAARAAELRRKVTALLEADITISHPLGLPERYDLVASFFCIEATSRERADWEVFLGRLARLVAPSGRMILVGMHHCDGYEVLGKSFPATWVDVDDYARVLPGLGFAPDRSIIRVMPITEWVDEGFDSICLVSAEMAE